MKNILNIPLLEQKINNTIGEISKIESDGGSIDDVRLCVNKFIDSISDIIL